MPDIIPLSRPRMGWHRRSPLALLLACGVAAAAGGWLALRDSGGQQAPTQTAEQTFPEAAPAAEARQSPVAQPAQDPPPDPPKKRTWREQARHELGLAKSMHTPAEPWPKPPRMDAAQYQAARKLAEKWLREVTPDNVVRFYLTARTSEAERAADLLPASVARWEMEGSKQLLDQCKDEAALDKLVAANPRLRHLKQPDVQARLRARAPWKERRRLYQEFARLTGDKRPWSLLLPFDDLDAELMGDAVAAARKANEKGLAGLEEWERLALLAAHAFDFFEAKLGPGK